jgi:hypothetical protein
MTDQTSRGNSDAPKAVSDDGTLNETAFMAALAQSYPPEESPKPDEAEDQVETEEETEEAEEATEVEAEETTEEDTETETEAVEETEETDDSEEKEDVLSQIDWENADWDNFDTEEIPSDIRAKIADKFGGSVGHVIGKLRKEKAKAEKARESAEAQLREGLAGIKAIPTEFKEIGDTEALDTKSKEWRGQLNNIQKYLDTPEEVFDINGQDFSRDQLVGWRDYYNNLIDQVPDYRSRLKEAESYSESEVMAEVAKDVPELANEESDAYKAWSKIVNDPKMAVIKQLAPKQYAEIQKMAAHSVAFKSKSKALPKSLPRKKPKMISGKSNGARSQNTSGESKAVQEARKRIQSGNYTEKDLRLTMFGR